MNFGPWRQWNDLFVRDSDPYGFLVAVQKSPRSGWLACVDRHALPTAKGERDWSMDVVKCDSRVEACQTADAMLRARGFALEDRA